MSGDWMKSYLGERGGSAYLPGTLPAGVLHTVEDIATSDYDRTWMPMKIIKGYAVLDEATGRIMVRFVLREMKTRRRLFTWIAVLKLGLDDAGKEQMPKVLGSLHQILTEIAEATGVDFDGAEHPADMIESIVRARPKFLGNIYFLGDGKSPLCGLPLIAIDGAKPLPVRVVNGGKPN